MAVDKAPRNRARVASKSSMTGFRALLLAAVAALCAYVPIQGAPGPGSLRLLVRQLDDEARRDAAAVGGALRPVAEDAKNPSLRIAIAEARASLVPYSGDRDWMRSFSLRQ